MVTTCVTYHPQINGWVGTSPLFVLEVMLRDSFLVNSQVNAKGVLMVIIRNMWLEPKALTQSHGNREIKLSKVGTSVHMGDLSCT